MSVIVRLVAIALLVPSGTVAAQRPKVKAAPSATIVLSPTSLIFTVPPGSGKSSTQSVAITNGGGGTLSGLKRGITYTSPHVGTDGLDVNWLQSAIQDKHSTTAPASLDVTAHAPATLPPGTYRAQVSIESKTARNSPQVIEVLLLVGSGLTVTPATTDFGLVGIGEFGSRVFTVTNPGPVSSGLLSVSLTGSNAAEFNKFVPAFGGSDGCFVGLGSPIVLAAGQSCTLSIAFGPQGSGPRTASMTVSADPGGSGTSELAGTGVVPSLTLAPAPADFGPVGVGEHRPLLFTVTNSGQVPSGVLNVTFTGPNGTEFTVPTSAFYAPDNCYVLDNGAFQPRYLSLDGGSSCVLGVDFGPQGEGMRTATLTVSTARGARSMSDLTGTGVVPSLTIVPAPADFGPVGAGEHRGLTFTVTNSGQVPSGVLNVSVTGPNSTEFTVPRLAFYSPGDCYVLDNGAFQPRAISLNGGDSCVLGIDFGPQGERLRTATLTVSTDRGANTTSDLTGTGTGVPVLAIAPTSYDFGSVVLGQASAAQAFTVTNQGSTPVDIFSFGFSGLNTGFSLAAGTCGAPPLAAGATCTIGARFAPETAGLSSSTLRVITTAGDTALAAVTGTGVGVATIAVAPASQDFGTVVIGQSSPPADFTITNTGSGRTGPLLSVVFSGPGASDYSTSLGTCPPGAGIDPGASCTFRVTFAPQIIGKRPATLTVTATEIGGGGVSATADLDGRGAPVLAVTPASFDFGTVALGTPAPPTTFTVTNNGGERLFLNHIDFSGTNAPDFAVDFSNLSCAVFLEPGNSCSFNVAFTPQAPGPRSANVTISSSSGTAAGSAALSGTGAALPAIAITPASYDMGSVYVGQRTGHQFRIDWNVSGPVLNTSWGVTGPGAAAFDASDLQGWAETALAPGGGNLFFFVTFAPQVIGPQQATVVATITMADGTVHTATVEVTGNGTALTILPASHDFGSVILGLTSATADFTVTNGGNATLFLNHIDLTGSDPADFEVDRSNLGCAVFLTPGASCTFSMFFRPHVLRGRSATVTISSGPGTPSGSAELTGTGVDGVVTLAVSPESHDFGALVVGIPAQTATFTVTNTGNTQVFLNHIDLTGPNAADFAVDHSDLSCVNILGPGASCTFAVGFTPQAAGPRSATVTISQGPGTPSGSANLTGTGIAQSVILTVTPASRDFGPVAVGQASPTANFTVTNTGNWQTFLNHIDFTGPNAADFAVDVSNLGCAVILGPGASCTFSVFFRPQDAGARSATVTISQGPGTPSGSANLTGTGTGGVAVLAFTPSSVDFGNRPVNYVLGGVSFFTITNTGSTSAAPLDRFVFTGAAPADFSIADQYCLGVSLAPGASCNLSVQFIARATGPRSATLTVSSSTDGTSGSAQVSGTGVPPAILTVTPPSKDFGAVTVGQTSALVSFVVTNTGPVPAGLVVTTQLSGRGSDDYVFPYNECYGVSLGVGASCEFRVRFSPKGGASQPATFQMVFQGGTATVNFTGVGTSPNALLTVSPDSQDFGLVFLGASSAIKTITVTNTGGDISGSLVNFTFTGPSPRDFGFLDDSNHCYLQQLAAGASCTIGLIFSPQTYGRRAATLTISAPGGPTDSVKLTGGMTPGGVLTITPTSQDFGTIPVGSFSLPTQFTVTNSGTSSALFAGIVIDEEAGIDYALEAGSTCAGTPFLAAGASCTIFVHFEPRQAGPLPATLFVWSDGPAVSAPLTGIGTPGDATPTVGGSMELTSFTPTDAARDLLGVPNLTASQRVYLDRLGNQDGAYDLGDLLAFLDRNHIKLSPALLARPANTERVP